MVKILFISAPVKGVKVMRDKNTGLTLGNFYRINIKATDLLSLIIQK